MMNNNVHILAITETHLCDTINDGQSHLVGFNMMRRDRNRYEGGVALYIQNHNCLQRRDDFCVGQADVIWVHMQLPHQLPMLTGCVYSPPKSKMSYLEDLCSSIDKATEENTEVPL